VLEQSFSNGMDRFAIRLPVDDRTATAWMRGATLVHKTSVDQCRQVVTGCAAREPKLFHNVLGRDFVMIHHDAKSAQSSRRGGYCRASLVKTQSRGGGPIRHSPTLRGCLLHFAK
jgi:hypothetical protein